MGKAAYSSSIHSYASLEDIGSDPHDACSPNTIYKKLENKNKALKASFKAIQNCLEAQNQTLARHTVYLEKLVAISYPESEKPILNFFPIKSKVEFAEIENNLDNYSKDALTHYIKEIVGSVPVEKTLHHFFDEQFLLQINWDGYRNKLGMKTSRLFSEFVFGAVRQEGQYFSDFENAMKKGFRLYKNKTYKKICLSKKPSI